jgi:uncharacterized lipoprotein YajG
MNTRIILALTGIFLLVGCASPNGRVNPTYTPDKKSALSTLKPLTVLLQLEDQRPPEERAQVGKRGKGKILSSKDAPLVLRDALKAEFEQNGHRVVGAPPDTADASVKVQLKRFFSDFKLHLMNGEVIATIVTDVTVNRPPQKCIVDALPLNTTFHKAFAFAGKDSVYEAAINEALAEYVRSFSIDLKITEALQGSP